MSRMKEEQVRKAVNALLKWNKLQHNTNPSSDEEDNFIYLLTTLKKTPPKELTTPHKISLPHPLLQHSSNICLIIDDRPKTSKTKLDVEKAQKKIKDQGLPITKVLKFTKLKAQYKSFESKRELYGSYEVFLADKRVMHLLPALLGKQFYKKKRKVPLPVDLIGGSSWKEEVEGAFGSALLCLGSGTCSVVKVGRGGMESGEIVDNVVAAVEGIVGFVPKKWDGVRAFHLKFSESLALPVYEDSPGGSKLSSAEGEAGTLRKSGDKKRKVSALDNVQEVMISETLRMRELKALTLIRAMKDARN